MSDYTAANRPETRRDVFKGMSKKSKAKEAKKDPSPAIRQSEYGRYQIKSGCLSGVYVARAFPKPETRARGLIAEATGTTEDAAITALHTALDARQDRRNEDRRTDAHTGASVPSTEEYMEALNTVSLTRPQRAMLMALSLAEADGLEEAMVANAGSYKSPTSANRALASVGRMIEGYLSLETGSSAASANSDETALIGYRGLSENEGKPAKWILHPELCTAIRNVI